MANFGFGLYAETQLLIDVARELQDWLEEVSSADSDDVPQVSVSFVGYAAGIDVDQETVWDSENNITHDLTFEYVKELFLKRCVRFAAYAHLGQDWINSSH